jgi:phytoene dehydrogenase-like protein
MPKNENFYDAIIVGAGAAGLTAAAYLCKYGYRVLLCEQAKEVGGLVNSFEYKGFLFDTGIRAFENSGIIFPMLKQLEIDIPFVKNSVSIGIKNDVIQLHSKESLLDYEELLIKNFPAEREDIKKILGEIKKVMGYMDVIYGIENPLFLDYLEDKEYLFQTLFPWLIKYQKEIKKASRLSKPVNEYLGEFTYNQSLVDLITQHFFKNTPAFFALSYFGLYLDYSYPIGGTGVLAQKLRDYIEKHQGTVLTETKISTINVEKNQTTTADNRNYGYQKLVWACDVKQLYKAMEGSAITSKRRIKTQKKLVENHGGGDSILTVFLGVDLRKDYFEEKCGAHCFYTPDTAGISSATIDLFDSDSSKETMICQIINYLKHTTYEISCPVLRDDTLAPEGKSGLIISTLIDYHLVKEIDDVGWYEEFKDLCIKTVIQVMDETILKGLKSKVLFSLCSTPLTIENLTSSTEGAITGWAFADNKLPSQTSLKKITKSVFTPIPDVYQAGQWSFSPAGLPVCILTGKVAADEIKKSLRKTKVRSE